MDPDMNDGTGKA